VVGSIFLGLILALVIRSYDFETIVAKFSPDYEVGPRKALIQLNSQYVQKESALEKRRVQKEKASRKDLALFEIKTGESSQPRFHE